MENLRHLLPDGYKALYREGKSAMLTDFRSQNIVNLTEQERAELALTTQSSTYLIVEEVEETGKPGLWYEPEFSVLVDVEVPEKLQDALPEQEGPGLRPHIERVLKVEIVAPPNITHGLMMALPLLYRKALAAVLANRTFKENKEYAEEGLRKGKIPDVDAYLSERRELLLAFYEQVTRNGNGKR